MPTSLHCISDLLLMTTCLHCWDVLTSSPAKNASLFCSGTSWLHVPVQIAIAISVLSTKFRQEYSMFSYSSMPNHCFYEHKISAICQGWNKLSVATIFLCPNSIFFSDPWLLNLQLPVYFIPSLLVIFFLKICCPPLILCLSGDYAVLNQCLLPGHWIWYIFFLLKRLWTFI